MMMQHSNFLEHSLQFVGLPRLTIRQIVFQQKQTLPLFEFIQQISEDLDDYSDVLLPSLWQCVFDKLDALTCNSYSRLSNPEDERLVVVLFQIISNYCRYLSTQQITQLIFRFLNWISKIYQTHQMNFSIQTEQQLCDELDYQS